MTALVALTTIAVVIVVLINVYQDGRKEFAWAQERDKWTEERRELLNRIQRPDRLPVPEPAADYMAVEEEPDELNLVGTINYDTRREPDDLDMVGSIELPKELTE